MCTSLLYVIGNGHSEQNLSFSALDTLLTITVAIMLSKIVGLSFRGEGRGVFILLPL